MSWVKISNGKSSVDVIRRTGGLGPSRKETSAFCKRSVIHRGKCIISVYFIIQENDIPFKA